VLKGFAHRDVDQRGRARDASGTFDPALLEVLLRDPYFAWPAPKSTGRERFNEAWLQRQLAGLDSPVADVNLAATMLELTARSIASAVATLDAGDYQLIVCGGGARNEALMARLGTLTRRRPLTTASFGLDPDFVEAAAMAWLAHERVAGRPGNLPTVTAAREAVALGAVYCGVKRAGELTL
jgi:anhydro-N-acetylmuramic acid kinase